MTNDKASGDLPACLKCPTCGRIWCVTPGHLKKEERAEASYEITSLRAKLAAAEAEKAEIRRVANAELDRVSREMQAEIEGWQNERNHARQDCDEALAQLQTARKALEGIVAVDQFERRSAIKIDTAGNDYAIEMVDGNCARIAREALRSLTDKGDGK